MAASHAARSQAGCLLYARNSIPRSSADARIARHQERHSTAQHRTAPHRTAAKAVQHPTPDEWCLRRTVRSPPRQDSPPRQPGAILLPTRAALIARPELTPGRGRCRATVPRHAVRPRPPRRSMYVFCKRIPNSGESMQDGTIWADVSSRHLSADVDFWSIRAALRRWDWPGLEMYETRPCDSLPRYLRAAIGVRSQTSRRGTRNCTAIA